MGQDWVNSEGWLFKRKLGLGQDWVNSEGWFVRRKIGVGSGLDQLRGVVG